MNRLNLKYLPSSKTPDELIKSARNTDFDVDIRYLVLCLKYHDRRCTPTDHNYVFYKNGSYFKEKGGFPIVMNKDIKYNTALCTKCGDVIEVVIADYRSDNSSDSPDDCKDHKEQSKGPYGSVCDPQSES
jgi:hypothetical protein